MSAIAAVQPAIPSWEKGLFVFLILLTTVVLAETVEKLENNPDYDDLNREEIFNSNKEWRLELPPEDEFRPAEPIEKDNSRIKIGADYDYQEIRSRDRSMRQAQQQEFGSDRPTSILRFTW